MDPRPALGRLSDRGLASVQFLLAAGMGMILFLLLANLVVVQYGRGAIRSALDQGVRVGTVTASATDCQRRIDEVLGQLLGGTMGEAVTTWCLVGDELITAGASGAFQAWTPWVEDFDVEMTATAARELLP